MWLVLGLSRLPYYFHVRYQCSPLLFVYPPVMLRDLECLHPSFYPCTYMSGVWDDPSDAVGEIWTGISGYQN